MSKYDWKSEYNTEVKVALDTHYSGKWSNVTTRFPSLRNAYPWDETRPTVPDSRVVAKNNEEYHGLERHANQYHATRQYQFAYQHWLLAAALRKMQMDAFPQLKDSAHVCALQYTLKHVLFNKAAYAWQGKPFTIPPQPKDFELKEEDLAKKIKDAEAKIESYKAKIKEQNPAYSSASTFTTTITTTTTTTFGSVSTPTSISQSSSYKKP